MSVHCKNNYINQMAHLIYFHRAVLSHHDHEHEQIIMDSAVVSQRNNFDVLYFVYFSLFLPEKYFGNSL